MLKFLFTAVAATFFLFGCASQKQTPPVDHTGAYLEYMKDEKNRRGISDQDQKWTWGQKRCFDKWYFGLFSPKTQRNLDESVSGGEKFSAASWEEMGTLHDRIFDTTEGKKEMVAAKAECGITE